MTRAAPDPGPVLRVDGLGKKFARDLRRSQRYGVSDILSELHLARRPERELRQGEFWALRDVTFDVAPGEALGVIGHNGAGKSTLLRVLNGLMRPDAGSALIRGTTSALIELGAPFASVLTGRENIITSAVLQGIDREQTEDLIEAVADFAELGAVLDAPVRTYSTGMQMRLGFAIASQLNPDLMLVDEVIAVGDIGFQRKCVQYINRYLNHGGSLLLVSHDLWMIQAICSRCLVMAHGRVVEDTTPNNAISAYLSATRFGGAVRSRLDREVGGASADEPNTPADDAPVVEVHRIEVQRTGGGDPRTNEPASIEVEARAAGGPLPVRWRLEILTGSQMMCIARLEPPEDQRLVVIEPTGNLLRCDIPELPLFPSLFHLSVVFLDPLTDEPFPTVTGSGPFEVAGSGTRLETLAQISAVISTVHGRFSVGGDQASVVSQPSVSMDRNGR
jgi:lipopolysaccharide transport system ATP-binding protein